MGLHNCYKVLESMDICNDSFNWLSSSLLIYLYLLSFRLCTGRSTCPLWPVRALRGRACAVSNLTVSSNPQEPSVTLNWSPLNDRSITAYKIRFKVVGSRKYTYQTVSAATTSFRITQHHGLTPLTRTRFEVRTCGRNSRGRWTAVETFVGMAEACYCIKNYTQAVRPGPSQKVRRDKTTVGYSCSLIRRPAP